MAPKKRQNRNHSTDISSSMLTGRESLLRLIGKRRRFLPNRQSIVSNSIQNDLGTSEDRNVGNMLTKCSEGLLSDGEIRVSIVKEDEKSVTDVSASDWVKCPVCGNTVCGEGYTINAHLDACLARGTKRKLTQLTLLQSKFWSRSTKTDINELDNLGTYEVQRGSSDNLTQNTSHKLLDVRALHENNTIQCSSPDKSEIMQTYASGLMENPITDDKIKYTFDTPSLPLKEEKLKLDKVITMDNISGEILHTFIVGRRFSDEDEIHLGTCISLLRDPKNVKDPNAIKVISTDSGCCKVLGYLPRELAQYLSPLIEKFSLSLEGSVVSVPKHSHDIVPIQILCQQVIPFSEQEHDDLRIFESLWKNVLCVVESAKTYSPMTKYQQNFSLLIQEVLLSNSHLFTKDEAIFLESFTSLSDDCQRLFIRLYTRKGPWFRMSNIYYPEISNSQEAVKKLSATGYICSFECINELHDDDMEEILNLLTVPELRAVSCMLKKVQKCNHGTKKQDIISSIFSSYKDGLCPFLPGSIINRTGDCIRISAKAESLIWRAERLFFLNGEQDLSAFLLVDLGIIKYPTYNCQVSDQIFSSRNDLLAYEEAIEVAQIMDQSLDKNDSQLVLRCIQIADSCISYPPAERIHPVTSESVAIFMSCFSASWIYSKVVLLGVSFFEREHRLRVRRSVRKWILTSLAVDLKYELTNCGCARTEIVNLCNELLDRYSDAINLLKHLLNAFQSTGRRGYWTLRLSIDLEHVGHLDKSLSVAENGLLDPSVRAGSRIALQRRVLRLGKPPRRWKVPNYAESINRKITEIQIQGRPLNSETGMKSRFYGEDGEQCGVEQLALQYYAGEGGGWQGVHTESGIWLTIFGLLMWNIMFADVPNVFRTKFQTSPLDLETDDFYSMRKDEIESHLQKIHDGMAEEILIVSWESNIGTACRGVNWNQHSLSVLRAAVTCVGGPCLASICRHLAQDYRSWSRGMPDLLLWRFSGDYSGEAKLVEVKGPRDRLSEQQRAWLLILMDCGFNAEVCKVSPKPIST